MNLEPNDIASQYKNVFKNHEPEDIHITLAEFTAHLELEETTEEELADLEYLCDRIDLWCYNLGRPSAYDQGGPTVRILGDEKRILHL
jgi:hypothetical protein